MVSGTAVRSSGAPGSFGTDRGGTDAASRGGWASGIRRLGHRLGAGTGVAVGTGAGVGVGASGGARVGAGVGEDAAGLDAHHARTKALRDVALDGSRHDDLLVV